MKEFIQQTSTLRILKTLRYFLGIEVVWTEEGIYLEEWYVRQVVGDWTFGLQTSCCIDHNSSCLTKGANK